MGGEYSAMKVPSMSQYTLSAGDNAGQFSKNLNSCFDKANLELRYLAEPNEPDEFQILAGSYAHVPIAVLKNPADCIADFLTEHRIETAVDSSDFKEWFLRSFTQSRINLPELDTYNVCGLALHLCDVFRTATSQSMDIETACSWALSLVRDTRIDPNMRMDAIADTVRRTLNGDRSEFLKAALRVIKATELNVIVALHLDAMQQAHGESFPFARSMPVGLAQHMWNRTFDKTQVRRVFSHFESVGLIEYVDRGCNQQRRSAVITPRIVQTDWPNSKATDAIIFNLSTSIIQPVSPRKLYTRDDSSRLSVQMDAVAVKEAVRGHWRAVLIKAGLSEAQTRKSKTTCPFCCAGKQWRLGDRDGNGSGICDKCSPTGLGDGFLVLQKLNDWSFVESLDFVRRYLNGEQIAIKQPTITAAKKTLSPKQNDQKLPDGDSYQRVLTEWCCTKSVDPTILAHFGAKPAYRWVRDTDDALIHAVVVRVPLYAADSDGNPVVSGHCDFGTATDLLRKGLNGKGMSGVFLRSGVGFSAGQLIYAVEGVKDAASMVALGKYAVCGLPGLHVPKSARALLSGCRVVLIPDREAIEKHVNGNGSSPLALCMASLWTAVKTTEPTSKTRGNVIVCDLEHSSYSQEADDLRDILKVASHNQKRDLIKRLDQHEAVAGRGKSKSGDYVVIDTAIRKSTRRFAKSKS